MFNLAIDIGGTYIKYAIVNEFYTIVKKWKVPTRLFNNKDDFYDYLCENMENIENIERIGVSAPGLIDSESYVRSYAAPNVKIMFGTSIKQEIEARVGRPTKAINDAKAAGVCEFRLGHAINSKSSACIIIGTGTGGCLCDENGVIYGADGFAGEFHFIPFWHEDSQQLLKLGNQSSIRGLITIYCKLAGIETTNSEAIIVAYLAGDAIAHQAVEKWIYHIAIMAINIICFYNPEVICFGGEISKAPWFIETVSARVYKISEEYFKSQVFSTKLVPCKFYNDANLLGALLH